MSLFDTVRVKCPKCGKIVEFQSKAGHCHLLTYTEDHVPTAIAVDLAGKTEKCLNCGTNMVFNSSVPIYARGWVQEE